MYPVGVPVAINVFLTSGVVAWFIIAAALLILLLFVIHAPEMDGVPEAYPGSTVLSTWRFFGRRFDFLNEGFRITGQAIFQFHLLQVSDCP